MTLPDLEQSMRPPKGTLSELYDAYFKTRFGFDPRRDVVWKEVVRWIQQQYIPTNARVLDCGAGYCNFINNVQASERHAIDVFTKFHEYAAPGVVTHHSTVTDMSMFKDDSFDVLFASNLAEHLSRPDLITFLANARRVLRLDGLLMLMQPNFKYCSTTYFDDYTHIQIFTDASLADFLEAFGFNVIGHYAKFMPVNMKSTLRLKLPMLPLLVRTYLRMPFKPLAGQMLLVAKNKKISPSRIG